jgi:hypothetical protein
MVLFIISVVCYYIGVTQTNKKMTKTYAIEAAKSNTLWQEYVDQKISKVHETYAKAEIQKDIEFKRKLVYIISGFQPKLDMLTIERITGLIISESKINNLDPILVTALIWVESRFDPLAKSKKEAIGLMQVRYTVWKKTPILDGVGVDDKHKLYWVDMNIKCGTRILAKYYKESNYNIMKALYRYNTGSKSIPDKTPIFEIKYVNKIILTAYRISNSM